MDKTQQRKSLREDALNLPNFLTSMRIVLIPLVLWLMWVGTRRANFEASLVYAVTAITDYLDGWLARKRNLVSMVGKFLDPLADKLLVTAVLVQLVAMGRAPSWVAIVTVARELSITSLRVIAMSEGVTIAAGQGGKEKTAIQMVAIAMLIIHHRYVLDYGVISFAVSFHDVGLVLLYLSLFFAVTSAGEYVSVFATAIEKKNRQEAEDSGSKSS